MRQVIRLPHPFNLSLFRTQQNLRLPRSNPWHIPSMATQHGSTNHHTRVVRRAGHRRTLCPFVTTKPSHDEKRQRPPRPRAAFSSPGARCFGHRLFPTDLRFRPDTKTSRYKAPPPNINPPIWCPQRTEGSRLPQLVVTGRATNSSHPFNHVDLLHSCGTTPVLGESCPM